MFAVDTSYQSVRRSRLLAASLCFHTKTTNFDLGNAGERLAIAMLQEAGFIAKKILNEKQGDIVATCPKTGEIFHIEVKTATKSQDSNRWQFCLKRAKKTDNRHADYILFLAIDKNDVFSYLVPSEFFEEQKQFTITSHPVNYRGKIAAFRNRGALSFQAACNAMELKRLQ